MKETAFHQVNLRHGAKMREMFGYWLPWEYSTGHTAEHLGTRQRASLCDLDYMGECSIEGPDAAAFVQRVFTNDFRNLAVGRIRYTAMCDPDGHMVDDGTVWRFGEDRFRFVSGDEADYQWLVEQAAGSDLTLTNITGEVSTLALQGPSSRDVLAGIADVDLADIRYYGFVPAHVAGVDCLIAGMGYTGESGYEVHFHPRHAPVVWDAIMAAGAAIDIVPLGQAGLESLRQEAGYILVGNDHDRSTDPLEAGIGWTVRFEKPAFNGRDALLDVLRGGVRRRLVWFRLRSGAIAEKGASIFNGATQIGEVTSGSWSPTFKDGTAMGYVRPEFAIPGVDFEIEVDSERTPATLSIMPRYDPGDWLTKRHA
jgi:aminomethyltransferase